MMMKKILITTDFSAQSRHTLGLVLNHLKDTKDVCQIILLNTYLVQYFDPELLISVNDELKIKSRAGLEQEKALAIKLNTNKNVSIEIATHIGSLNNVIQYLVRRDGIDMVAMGKEDGNALEAVKLSLKDHTTCSLFINELAV
jgi:hypothetical protein